MSNLGKTAADFTTQLAATLEVGATTGTLQSVTDEDGNALTNGLYYFTLEGSNSQKEYIQATITGTALTGIQSLSRQGVLTSSIARKHRVGSVVEITNFGTLQKLVGLLDGTEDFDADTPLKYDAEPTLTDRKELATRGFVLDNVNGGTVSTNRVTVAGNAGETVAAGDWIYFKTSDQEWYKADADTEYADDTRFGIAQGAGVDAGAISGGVLRSGLDENQAGMTPGATQYGSATAGDITESAPTNDIFIGVALSATNLLVNFENRLTDYLSSETYNDDITSSGNDQAQTTADSSTEFGEADTTTNKNKTAQSFIPAKTKIRGVKLDKDADDGTFTGTVTVSIQADSSSEPDGTALATKTIANDEWIAAPVGELEVLFDSEYDGLVIGDTYWIVIEASTADNANHPNIGHNVAGGYASGSAKYNNATDGWTALATIDLYFKTLEGNNSQLPLLGTDGKLPADFYDVNKMPVPAFYQEVDISTLPPGTFDIAREVKLVGSGSNRDGSVVYTVQDHSLTSAEIIRYERDAKTGMYFATHYVSGPGEYAEGESNIAVTDDYIYIFYDGGTNLGCRRYDADDLTGSTTMSFNTAVSVSGSDVSGICWSDGTFLYARWTGTNVIKLSVSGTTFTQESSNALPTLTGTAMGAFFDGTDLWIATENGANNPNIYIYKMTTITGGAISTTKTVIWPPRDATNTHDSFSFFPIDNERVYLGKIWRNSTVAGTFSNRLELTPVSNT